MSAPDSPIRPLITLIVNFVKSVSRQTIIRNRTFVLHFENSEFPDDFSEQNFNFTNSSTLNIVKIEYFRFLRMACIHENQFFSLKSLAFSLLFKISHT